MEFLEEILVAVVEFLDEFVEFPAVVVYPSVAEKQQVNAAAAAGATAVR